MKQMLLAPVRAVLRALHSFSPVRKFLLGIFVKLHYFSYLLIKKFVIPSGRSHPKHELLQYNKFFVENVSPEDDVLDVGCAKGDMSRELAKKAKNVVGIDVIQKDVEKAKKETPREVSKNLTFIHGDATAYPFDRRFDVVTLSNVLEHIEDRDAFLQKIHRLAPKILVRVPLATRDWLAYYLRENGYEYRLDPTHYTEYTEEEIRSEIKRNGYEVQDCFVKWGEWYGICKTSSS